MEKRLRFIIGLAYRIHVSDIHFKVQDGKCQIQMRLGDDLMRFKNQRGDQKLLPYLKYLSNMDVGKLTTPQTGQFEMQYGDETLSLRFAAVDKPDFCVGVLRILNPAIRITSKSLSGIQNQNKYFRSLLKKECGLVIFSGATGSGKTTTMYSLLNDAPDKKIYTLEDPIEIHNNKFVQIEINESAGLDYATGIKQILRHDPDIIMIGEIRDEKAAKMAVVAANTGHLVFATIHAPRASSIISRMIDLGVNAEHLYENLLCLSYQRMVSNKTRGDKRVYYEIMDRKEIEYYQKYHKNSESFLSVRRQLNEE